MPLATSRVKTPLGMRLSYFYPIESEPENQRPVYGIKLDMGAAVKGYLSVTTASGSIPGDDIEQVSEEKFISGQLDAETTMNDLEINARIYGHTMDEADGEISKSDDHSIYGGYGFIEPFMRKDKTMFFRATALLRVTAMASTEKQEADTKKSGELTFKNYAVSYKVAECNTGEWRCRLDFSSQKEAEEYLNKIFKQDEAAQKAAAASNTGATQSN